jgi:hypothetical protein
MSINHLKKQCKKDLRISQKYFLLTDLVNSWTLLILGSHSGSLLMLILLVDVGSVANLSDVHAASIFRVRVSWVGEYSHTHRFWSNTPTVGRVGAGALSEPAGTMGRKKLSYRSLGNLLSCLTHGK